MVLIVLTHQLVAVIMFGIVALSIMYDMFRKGWVEAQGLIAASLPAALLFLPIIYFSPTVPEYRVILGFSRRG